MKGVFLDVASLDRQDIDFSALKSDIKDWTFHANSNATNIAERIKGASVVVSNKAVLDRAVLSATDTLQLVCIAATGTNNIDLDAVRELDIKVCNVTAYATSSVVEHVFMLLLSLARNSNQYRQAVDEGRWEHSDSFSLLDYPIFELSGKILGIVGYGELGRAVANVAKAFGMDVLVADHAGRQANELRPGRTAFETVLQQADVVSLHCPLDRDTQGLIGAHELSLMKPGAILINTARGGLVDADALVQSLQTGHLAAAGIDVLAEEPPVSGNPLLHTSLTNLLVTPHIAWASRESRQRLVNEIGLNISAFMQQQPRNLVS